MGFLLEGSAAGGVITGIAFKMKATEYTMYRGFYITAQNTAVR